MQIMTSWMNPDDLEGVITNHNYKVRDGDSLVNVSNVSSCLDCNFATVIRQMIPTVCATLLSHYIGHEIKSFPDHNFEWYVSVMEVNTELVSRHFQNDGDIIPTLDIWRKLVIQCIKITIGTEPGNIGRPMQACRRPQLV